jgi:hypothetical protein
MRFANAMPIGRCAMTDHLTETTNSNADRRQGAVALIDAALARRRPV